MGISKLTFCALLWMLWHCQIAFCQTTDNYENTIEFSRDEGILDAIEFQDKLLNLNHLDYEELRSFHFLSEADISSILLHKQQFGEFVDLLELQQCRLSVDKIRALSNAVFVQKSSVKLIKLQWESSVTIKTKIPSEQHESFVGNSVKMVFRQRYTNQKGLKLGLTSEKDAGESFLNSNRIPAPDYASFYAVLPIDNFNVFIGDYLINTGQGLVLGQGFSVGKSSLIMDVSNKPFGIKPNRSLDENRFFRGGAVQLIQNHWQHVLFGSYKGRDGNVQEDRISALIYSGLHRTERELAQKKSVHMSESGFYSNYRNRKLEIGFSGLIGRFDLPIIPGTALHQKFSYSGSNFVNLGLHHVIHLGSMRVFGEHALTQNGGVGFVEGLQWSIGRSVDCAFHVRYFGKRYQSFHGNTFTEQSKPGNERGIYSSIRWTSGIWSISGYMDMYQFMWPKFGANHIEYGDDLFIEMRAKPSKTFLIYLRQQTKRGNTLMQRQGKQQYIDESKSKWRLHVEHQINRTWRLRCRVELNQLLMSDLTSKTWGTLAYVDLRYKPNLFKFDFQTRITTAYAEKFANRIYAFENDVPLSYSLPFYYGESLNYYLLAHVRVNQYLDIWGRFSYQNKTENVSWTIDGLYIAGQSNKQLTIHLRCRF